MEVLAIMGMEGPCRPIRPCVGQLGYRPVGPCMGLMGYRTHQVLMGMSPTIVVSTLVMVLVGPIWVNRRGARGGLLMVVFGWTMETARIPWIGYWRLIVVAHPQNNCYEIILCVIYYGASKTIQGL